MSKCIPVVVDLFSGCGGLALGFEKAGFNIVGGIEMVPEAVETISSNICWRYGRESDYICADITETDASIFKDRIGQEGCIVIGGPPCQAYSRAGKAKLNSLGEDRINTSDARGYLYQDFLRFAFDLDARAVVMENVPESTRFGDMNIPEIVSEELDAHGYDSWWTLLCAADYGVPQIRERVFIVGRKKGENDIGLPIPTHRDFFGYIPQYGRQIASFSQYKHFKPPFKGKEDLPPWITVGEAFSDLPSLFPSERSKYVNTPINSELPYRTPVSNSFQETMRNWYGFELFCVTGNTFRKNTRDFPIFARMRQGALFTDASRIADELFYKKAHDLGLKEGTPEYVKLKRQMVPIYDRESFQEKWRRLDENKPSHTVVAHLSFDTYSHIHPWEPRGISVREAARLQSFPDDFSFICSMGDAFKQIGNAVPPLLAYGLAKAVFNSYRD
jgi:DNA (cytosine-5)-methyltransferase 1